MPVVSGSYALELSGDRLFLQAWTATENLSRRITGVLDRGSASIDFAVERFGKRSGVLQVYDAAKPKAANVTRKAARQSYREQFRRSLLRQFPGWRIAEISTEPDLEHSLSPAYPRALLRKGQLALAAIGCPPDATDVDGVLTFGLIWLMYVRKRDRDHRVNGLAVFVPEQRRRATCSRMLYLDPNFADFSVFAYTTRSERQVDLRDYGNIDTTLPNRGGRGDAEREWWTQRLSQIDGVSQREEAGGRVSWTVRGLEFARWTPGSGLSFGLETTCVARESNLPEIESLGRELARMRAADASDRYNPLYVKKPELWFEAQVRASLNEIDASVAAEPVYRQAPAFAAGDRNVLDLLAADHTGRLVVVEVKVSEDLHLPLQALDYWIRVNWHAQRGDFARSGYFSGKQLRSDPPRLLLVAPALHYHPTTDSILQAFTPAVEVDTIGVGMDWRAEMKVMFRKRRGARP